MNKLELKKTRDGSHTLFIPELNETYHSVHGAIQEAKHVFINAGLHYLNLSKVKIFEVGFGTGLNVFLSYLSNNQKNIDYTTIDKFPLPLEIINQLNYLSLITTSHQDIEIFTKLHASTWNEYHQLTNLFALKKIKGNIANFQTDEKFNLIYFDAFAPSVQPEMWSKSVLTKMFNLLEKDGILVTYCAKGSVKRELRTIGFDVQTLPGPPGKREIIRAVKK